jgi:drug/metabolite transporter (DMT)-like permease
VIVGFCGVLVMLSPHLDVGSATASRRADRRRARARRRLLQRRLDRADPRLAKTETTSSIVLYFSLICAIVGLATWPFGWIVPTFGELVALCVIGICGGLAHILLTESYRLAPASLIAPFDYTSMLWALILGFLVFREVPSVLVFVGAGIIAGAGLFVIWRERQLGLQRARAAEGPPTGT